jgi:hypothetical protein
MKRFSLILVVLLLAVPALATVKITATDLGGGVVSIDYTVTSEPNLVRAFALDITVTDGNIIEVNDFDAGEDNGGFGIYPASFDAEITVLPDGTVPDWAGATGNYSPLADPCDPGTQPGLGTGGITVEMGSLYVTNAPGNSGQLCTVKVDTDCTLCVTLNSARGEVVLENASAPSSVDLTEACTTVKIVTDCLIGGNAHAGEKADWDAWGKPDCWCYRKQCRGDINGQKTGPFDVQLLDLQDLAAAYLKFDAVLATIPNGICADVDHRKVGPYRVQLLDLQQLATYYIKFPAMVPQCDAAPLTTGPYNHFTN